MLSRFATEKFSVEDEDLANIFIHLTNFTVNKNGDLNCDFPPGCQVKHDNMSPEIIFKDQGWQSGQKIGGFGFRILLHIFCIADLDSNLIT